jgi:hypothetical protein
VHETAAHETAAHVTANTHSEQHANRTTAESSAAAAAGNSNSSSNGHVDTSSGSSSGRKPWRLRLEKSLQVTRQLQVIEHYFSQD